MHRDLLPAPVALFAPALMALLAACAHAPVPAPPDVPEPLHAPAGQVAYLKALATGVQVYECTPKSDGTAEWVFKAPEASLMDTSGKPLGKHYAGPTWQGEDGSAVVGEVKAKAPSPDASAIPWLLLAAKSNVGAGAFAEARSIQRVDTVGGTAPAATACTGAQAGQSARVPYSASYYFYRLAP
jgi:hypothetical protein